MTYRLAPLTGDSIPVPQLIFSCLSRAGGEHVRVALYILATHSTDPRDIAHALGLKNIQAAQKSLDFWHGAGLLVSEKPAAVLPLQEEKPAPLTAEEIRLASLRDPVVSMLATETQNYLGRTLSQKDIQRIVSLYINESIPAEVIMLCAAHIASQGRSTVGQLERELDRWSQAGVNTGADAEQHLQLLALRDKHEEAVAVMLGIPVKEFNLADKRCIRRWYEEYGYNDSMIEEAILHAGANKEAKYVNGILKSWHAKGWQTLQDTRGAGGLEGSNIRVDRATPSGNDILRRAINRPIRLKRED